MKLNGYIGRRLASALAMLCASAFAAAAEADHGAIARAALTDYIRPAYAHFAKRTGALAEKMDALCASPGTETLKEAKTPSTTPSRRGARSNSPLWTGGSRSALRAPVLLA